VVTLYDLAPLVMPGSYDFERHQVLAAGASRAAAILVPSQAVATELMNLLHVDGSRTHVTYAGVDTAFRRLNPEQSAGLVQQRYGLDPGYLLSVGADHPAKNRSGIFLTLRRLLDEGRDVKLAIAGDDGSPSQDQLMDGLDLGDRVTFCGFVPQEDLPALYNSACALLHPALHDGLGLSVLEAMACSAPVIVSNRGTPAELAGEAGIVVDPDDVEAMAASVALILDDSSHTTRLRFDGLKRAADFSWEACAESTLAVYRRVLGEA
jgi:alpha-1,3-rhamnosyl/mannosyltransferase